MSETQSNDMSNGSAVENTPATGGVAGDRGRAFRGMTDNLVGHARSLLAKKAKQLVFVLVSLVLSVGGGILYYKHNHQPMMPAKAGSTTAANTGAPMDLGAAGDRGGAPAIPKPSTPSPEEAMPAQPSAPLEGDGKIPTPPNNSVSTVGPSNAPPPRSRLDASFFTEAQAATSGPATPGSVLNAVMPANVTGAQQNAGEFTGNLKGAATTKAQASLIGNRSLLLAKGTLIDCVLNTALTSGLPGMTSCTTTKPVYSDNGKTLLLDRGSLISGEFNGQMKTGQSRMYVLWTRVKTPMGVVANLDSPGADALGRPGVDGDLDKHWWDRIGSAFMLSMVQDAIGYAATRGAGNNNGTTQTYFQNTRQSGESIAAAILKDTINIPPTLSKNQGDRITVYVARDLDFTNVYAVNPTQ